MKITINITKKEYDALANGIAMISNAMEVGLDDPRPYELNVRHGNRALVKIRKAIKVEKLKLPS